MIIDVEDIGDELISILQSNLAANLTAIDSRKSTPYNPDPVAEYHFGEVQDTPLIPCVIVAPDRTATTYDGEYRAMSYSFVVELNYDAEDVEKCRRIISRYGSAIDDTLRASSGSSQLWASIENIGQQFSDTWTTRDSGLYQTVKLTFDVLLYVN